MQLFATSSGPGPTRGSFKIGRIGRLCLPVVAVLSIGFGISNYRDSRLQREYHLIQEEERLRRNAQLMDAYGDKTSLEDIQRALEQYKEN
ncbi:hypothetical protein VTN77DRAFT_6457 [Rasamsonia byssochlamydoides]|uniref:uncharacterized protein n=1 Tax=Rasamsonia byssochlamydoides TaxID=89139 RepID=UPI003743989E